MRGICNIYSYISRTRQDRRGVAGVEFALVVPVLLTMALGLVETTQVVRASMKLTHATGVFSKALEQQTAINGGSSGTLGDFCKAAAFALAPLKSTTLSADIASVTTPASGSGTQMDWENTNSCPVVTTAMGSSAAITLGKSLVPNLGDSVMIVRLSYVYSNQLKYLFPSSFTFTQTMFVRPRTNVTTTCTSGC